MKRAIRWFDDFRECRLKLLIDCYGEPFGTPMSNRGLVSELR